VLLLLLLASAKEGLFYRLQFIVGQIFSIYAIDDHKQLYVLKQAVIAPEWFWQLLIWLKASLISMSERLSSICTQKSIDQKCHVITILVASFQTDLISNLK
jgi:hypothetical protein